MTNLNGTLPVDLENYVVAGVELLINPQLRSAIVITVDMSAFKKSKKGKLPLLNLVRNLVDRL